RLYLDGEPVLAAAGVNEESADDGALHRSRGARTESVRRVISPGCLDGPRDGELGLGVSDVAHSQASQSPTIILTAQGQVLLASSGDRLTRNPEHITAPA